MKTITFYSFKGGVGRSLTLSNMALWLADEMKARVCVLDFDLEAPGLPYKFEDLQKNEVALAQLSQTDGLVEYVDEYNQTGAVPTDFGRFYLSFSTHKGNPIQLIPAGRVERPDYWNKVFRINWQELFAYDPATGYSNGLLLLEDLKGRIKQELNPDFLLIDSRTGLTEIAAITLKLLADKILLVGVNNRENQDGLFWVWRSLLADPSSKDIPVHLVLNRVPLRGAHLDPREEAIHQAFLEKFTSLASIESLKANSSLIHADDELAFTERLESGYIAETAVKAQLRKDYWDLFTNVLKPYFTPEVWAEFDRKYRAYNLYHAVRFKLVRREQRVDYLNEAIALCAEDDLLYLERATHFFEIGDFNSAKEDLLKTIKLNPENKKVYNNLGVIYDELGDYKNALKSYYKALYINSDAPSIIHFNMGVLYEAVGKINKAIKSYKKSIELGGATHHLRRLYAKMGGKEEAFKWLEESLRRGEVSMDDIMKDKDWENLRQDPAYLALVERFGGVARTD